MKVGSLVKWHTDAWVFKAASKRYANPGIVLRDLKRGDDYHQAYEVLWADGKITSEHHGYLYLVEVTEPT